MTSGVDVVDVVVVVEGLGAGVVSGSDVCPIVIGLVSVLTQKVDLS